LSDFSDQVQTDYSSFLDSQRAKYSNIFENTAYNGVVTPTIQNNYNNNHALVAAPAALDPDPAPSPAAAADDIDIYDGRWCTTSSTNKWPNDTKHVLVKRGALSSIWAKNANSRGRYKTQMKIKEATKNEANISF